MYRIVRSLNLLLNSDLGIWLVYFCLQQQNKGTCYQVCHQKVVCYQDSMRKWVTSTHICEQTQSTERWMSSHSSTYIQCVWLPQHLFSGYYAYKFILLCGPFIGDMKYTFSLQLSYMSYIVFVYA